MKRRKPWVAFALTQLAPGLGQLYNNDLRGVVVSILLTVIATVLCANFLFDSLGKLLYAFAIVIVLDLILSIQAFFYARRVKEIELKRYHRWWAYLLFTVVVYGLPDGYGYILPSRMNTPYVIPSESMVPTLLVGDHLIADGWSYWGKEPKRGDIVVFRYPKDPSVFFVKRLIGLPGDVVELKNGELSINQKLMPQQRTPKPAIGEGPWKFDEYVESLDGVDHIVYRAQSGGRENFGPIKVPPDNFFMMGDNRDRSSDSRVWGFVGRDALMGKMLYIYYSWEKEVFGRELEEEVGDRDLPMAVLAALVHGNNPYLVYLAAKESIRGERAGLQVH